MPLNSKNRAKVLPLKEKFDEGKCVEPPTECPEVPLIYCKQGLCVKKHEAGEKGKEKGTEKDTEKGTEKDKAEK